MFIEIDSQLIYSCMFLLTILMMSLMYYCYSLLFKFVTYKTNEQFINQFSKIFKENEYIIKNVFSSFFNLVDRSEKHLYKYYWSVSMANFLQEIIGKMSTPLISLLKKLLVTYFKKSTCLCETCPYLNKCFTNNCSVQNGCQVGTTCPYLNKCLTDNCPVQNGFQVGTTCPFVNNSVTQKCTCVTISCPTIPVPTKEPMDKIYSTNSNKVSSSYDKCSDCVECQTENQPFSMNNDTTKPQLSKISNTTEMGKNNINFDEIEITTPNHMICLTISYSSGFLRGLNYKQKKNCDCNSDNRYTIFKSYLNGFQEGLEKYLKNVKCELTESDDALSTMLSNSSGFNDGFKFEFISTNNESVFKLNIDRFKSGLENNLKKMATTSFINITKNNESKNQNNQKATLENNNNLIYDMLEPLIFNLINKMASTTNVLQFTDNIDYSKYINMFKNILQNNILTKISNLRMVENEKEENSKNSTFELKNLNNYKIMLDIARIYDELPNSSSFNFSTMTVSEAKVNVLRLTIELIELLNRDIQNSHFNTFPFKTPNQKLADYIRLLCFIMLGRDRFLTMSKYLSETKSNYPSTCCNSVTTNSYVDEENMVKELFPMSFGNFNMYDNPENNNDNEQTQDNNNDDENNNQNINISDIIICDE